MKKRRVIPAIILNKRVQRRREEILLMRHKGPYKKQWVLIVKFYEHENMKRLDIELMERLWNL